MSKNNYMGKIDEDATGITIPNYDSPSKCPQCKKEIKSVLVWYTGSIPQELNLLTKKYTIKKDLIFISDVQEKTECIHCGEDLSNITI